MTANRRLSILFLAQAPPSPAASGMQRRVEGLMKALAKSHDLVCFATIPPDVDRAVAAAAVGAYCRQVHLVVTPPWAGLRKRAAQLHSLSASRSFERRTQNSPRVRQALARLLETQRFDALCVESPFYEVFTLLAHQRDRPRLVLDEHNLEFDLARQQAGVRSPLRRLYNELNWRKIRREERQALQGYDAVAFCSQLDADRARALWPAPTIAVVPNAVDVDHFRPDSALPPADGCTVLFFGAINYFPNVDGLRFFFHQVWPALAQSHPRARLRIVGQHPTPEILSFRGPRVEVTGRVDDLRPLLSSAAVTVAPLRIGGGTRLKILEAMAMAKPVVATARGAEGIDAAAGREILVGESGPELVAHLRWVLDDPRAAAELGQNGRRLVERRYAWPASAATLEQLLRGPGGEFRR